MTQKSPLPVYLSITMPHLPRQEKFIANVEEALLKNNMVSKTLGRSEWSFEAPLIPIRKLIHECHGTVVIAMARTLIREGIKYVGSGHEEKLLDRYVSTPWIQIETAMAFQVNHPILVLKEDAVDPVGVLDPANTGLFVRSFSLTDASPSIPNSILTVLPAFRERVIHYAKERQ